MSLFGSASAPSSTPSLFGTTPSQQSGSLFGQPKPAGGSLFGQSNATPQPQSGGLFGQSSTNAQPQSGGLFGQSTQQPNTGGGLFGSSQPQQQQQTGGLFGQPQQQQTGGGMFGQQQQQQQQQQQGGGGLFGQTQGGGLFGQSQQQQQQPSGGLFGGSLQPQQSQYGTSFMGGMSGMNQSQLQQQQPGINPVIEKIQRIKNCWNPEHSDYAFRCYFYNYYGEERASAATKPENEDLAEWDKAMSERPNKGCIPVLAKGFKDLETRVKLQEQLLQGYRNGLWQLQEKLAEIQSHHDLHTSLKIEDCRRRHNLLARRALSLAAKVQVLKNRGYALQPEEEQLKKRLESLAKVVQDPDTTGRMNEIWARMTVVGEKAKIMQESLGKVEIVWDEKQLQIAGKLLQSNAAGLEHLYKEVKDIENSFARWEETYKDRAKGL